MNAIFLRLILLGLGLFLAACSAAPKHIAVPENLSSQAEVPGFQGIRFWGDEAPGNLAERLDQRVAELRALFSGKVKNGGAADFNILAMSGGAEDGAFGAGVLNGWTASKTRPIFDMVTGVSTGGLTAPFAFLGPEYDHVLKEVYTTITRERIYKACFLCGVFGGPSFSSTKPLAGLIREYVTAAVFEKIAAAHREGRRLWVATTNLDAGRPVIWDIGALANSGQPGALELFHKILLATAAIPGFFPPVLIDVEVDGKPYSEIHVDGGTTAMAFLYPAEVSAQFFEDRLDFDIKASLYLILNTRMPPQYQETDTDFFAIATRSLNTMVPYKGIGDALIIYDIARRDGLDFNMTLIPEDFVYERDGDFDPGYMAALYQRGYDLAGDSGFWLPAPPGTGNNNPAALEGPEQ